MPTILLESFGKDLAWEKYSKERVAELQKAGRGIFLDFTAAWCLTCQANEHLVLSSDGVKELFRKNNIALLRADWTNRDPEITAALAELNRVGVPLYVVYQAGKAEPVVLPQVLTPGILENYFSK
jgi:thiol:disulfide interchange protein